MLFEVGGQPVTQDQFVPHDYLEMLILSQEGLKVINGMSKVMRLGTVGENQRDSGLLTNKNIGPRTESRSTWLFNLFH